MRKFAIAALAFALCATMFTGCRGRNHTDMTTTNPSDQPGSSAPADTGRHRGDRLQDGNMPDNIGIPRR